MSDFQRMCRAARLAAVAVLLSGAVATVEPRAEGVEKSLACEFEGGTSSSYAGGTFMSRAPLPLRFSVVDIDLEQQSARLRTASSDAPSGTLRVIRALNANHFLEVVPEGFLNITTIYDIDPVLGAYPAVHSRHLGLLGQPVFAQYTGMCKAAN
jgi:hypothetical protein